jgi:hypothetical protein
MKHQFKLILLVFIYFFFFAAVYLKIPFFWDMSPRQTAVGSRRFDATFCPHLQGSECQLDTPKLQDDTTLSQNVGIRSFIGTTSYMRSMEHLIRFLRVFNDGQQTAMLCNVK